MRYTTQRGTSACCALLVKHASLQTFSTNRPHNIRALCAKLKAENGSCAQLLAQKNRHGSTALHEAAYNGCLEAVQALCELGADINATNSASHGKMNALMLACQQGYLPMVKYLIEQKSALVGSASFLQ